MFENIDGRAMGVSKNASIYIALIQWLLILCLGTDKFFAIFDLQSEHYSRVFIIFVIIFLKCLCLLALLFFWCFLFYVYQKYKSNNYIYRRAVRIFFIYAIFSIMLLIFLWPGTWSLDDLGVIENARYYKLTPWQHIFTSVFQIICLQILPFPGGIILIQNILISACVAFVIVNIETRYNIFLKNRIFDLLVKFFPFLLPPVLMYQFSGYRMGFYIYLEAVMFCILLCTIREKSHSIFNATNLSDEPVNFSWTSSFICFFSVISIIVSEWRAESFLYIPIIALMIIFLKNIGTLRKRIAITLLIIFGFMVASNIQSFALRNKNYEFISTRKQLFAILRVADTQTDAKLLSELNRVVDIDLIYKDIDYYASFNALQLVKNNYSKEDYKCYLRAFILLAIKYWKAVLNERANLFFSAVGIYGKDEQITNILRTINLYHTEPGKNVYYDYFHNANWLFSKPLFPVLRDKIIYFLGMQYSNGTESIFYRIIWNGLIPILFLFGMQFFMLLKKLWFESILLMAINLKTVIIFLTAPSPWLMYFLSQYLLGYFCMVYTILFVAAKYSSTHK